MRRLRSTEGSANVSHRTSQVQIARGLPAQTAETHRKAVFEPYKGKNRRRGTGCLTQIGKHLWEGRYSPKWPDGKIHSRNVYAGTSEECEAKLAELIRQMKAEIEEAKELAAQGKLGEAMALANEKKPRGTRRA